MPHASVMEFIEIDENEGGWPLLILPNNPNRWAKDLRKLHKEEGYIGMFAQNIPDGGKTVEVYFGDGNVAGAKVAPPTQTKYFGLVLDREVFRKMIKSLQLVLEASDSE